jgi:hypothetical protein
VIGLFAGMLLAQLVPSSGACAVPPRATRRDG